MAVVTYFGLWIAGGMAGSLAAVQVLRRRGACAGATLAAIVVAWPGFLYGAKLQYRLRYLEPLGAVLIPPGEILTPGFHVPLGLLGGWLLATLCCGVLRAPWREAGDALAVLAMTMLPIGRLGCWLSGCCAGPVCGPWAPFCARFAPGTEIHTLQVEAGLIGPETPFSLPVHPLPLYFGGADLVILAILVWQLRRGARPGMLLATGLMLHAVGQLAFEPLRFGGAERSPGLMAAVLLTMLFTGIAVRFSIAREARRAAPPRVAVMTTVAVAVLLSSLPRWVAAATEGSEAVRQNALSSYAQDGRRGRRRLFAGAREAGAALPAEYQLALADAHLRAGRLDAAAALFDTVLAATPSTSLAGWAHLGLGWVGLQNRDLPVARAEFAAAAGTSPSGTVAALMVAFLDAGDGGGEGALRTFEQMARDGEVTPDVRLAARLGAAYARYWAGDAGGARVAFEELAASDPSGALADDARYGAARAAAQAGDDSAAIAALKSLARPAGPAGQRIGPISDDLVALEPHAVLRAVSRRYRRLPPELPETQVLALLNGDGRALAHAALRRRRRDQAAPTASQRLSDVLVTAPEAVASEVAAQPRPRPSPASSAVSGSRRRSWLTIGGAVLLGLLALVTRWPRGGPS